MIENRHLNGSWNLIPFYLNGKRLNISFNLITEVTDMIYAYYKGLGREYQKSGYEFPTKQTPENHIVVSATEIYVQVNYTDRYIITTSGQIKTDFDAGDWSCNREEEIVDAEIKEKIINRLIEY